MQQLQPNTTLQGGKYRIERVLGQGGFGNTYVGYNTEFEETVAIKEFFMKGVTERDETTCAISVSNSDNIEQFNEQREKFKKEAQRIRKLDNSHIVKVHDLFEENGTAYYVMDFVEGENLAQRMKRTGKPMSEKIVREILPQLLDALKAVHDAGMWHLDLKPANIMLDKAGKVKLIDFGASKQLNAQKGGATTSTAVSYTNGYAPREQMEQNYDKFGPWTDIYALGATLYNLLTKNRPPMPSDIDDDLSEDKHNAMPFPVSTSADMKKLVLQMMQTNRMHRPQSVAEISFSSSKKTGKEIENSDETTIFASPDNNSDEETVFEPKEEKSTSKPNVPQDKLDEELDLSFLDDMEDTWKDKLMAFWHDFRYFAMFFSILVATAIIMALGKSCNKAINGEKEEEPIEQKDMYDSENAKVYDVVEEMPQYPGGSVALSDFLSYNIQYPEGFEKIEIEGRVVITFIVETDGSVSNVDVVTSINPSINEETIKRVVMSMGKWTPGKQNGVPVRVKYTIPLTFPSQ